MRNLEVIQAIRGVNVLIHGEKGPEHQTPAPNLSIIRGITENGRTFIQLRDKGMNNPDLIALGMQVRQSLPPETPLIINDNVKVALAIRDSGEKGLLGIHIGQNDASASEVRKLIGDDMILGVYASTVEEAEKAVLDGADYLGIGPLFPTKNKDDAAPPIGLRGLAKIRAALPDIPIIAIGGIDADNAQAVMRFGANGVAVIGAVLGADDPRQAAATLSDLVMPPERIPRLDQDGRFTQLDEYGDFVGRTIPRKEAEANNGHVPVVGAFLFTGEGEERRVLIHQRASTKNRWPGLWEGSMMETVQMHPSNPWEPEDPPATALRGLKEELGVEVDKNELAGRTHHRFIDRDPDTGAPITTSHITVYTVDCDREIDLTPDPAEVQAVEWLPVRTLLANAKDNPKQFAPGFAEFVVTYPELFK